MATASPAAESVLRLQRLAGNRAVVSALATGRLAGHGIVRSVQRKEAAADTVTVTVKWKRTAPRPYLQQVLDDNGIDWTADVYVAGKNVGSGDGSLTVTVPKTALTDKKKKQIVKVVPTKMSAADESDYFRSGSADTTKVTSSTLTVELPYNRTNQRFTRASWELAGLDATKVGKVKSTTMLGRRVTVNELVLPTVDKTNEYFESPKLTDEERSAVKSSIVSMGGYNKRTTSEGAYSNHSTGCAVDINAFMDLKINHHWKTSNASDKRVMSLFADVVKLDPAFAGYDPWSESDHDRILAASEAFNRRFPRHLASLLDDALGDDWLEKRAGTDAMATRWEGWMPRFLARALKALLEAVIRLTPLIMRYVDPKVLRDAATAAKKEGKSDTAKWLERIADDWSIVRAWVEGIVVYREEHKKDDQWAYTTDFALKDRSQVAATKGQLAGMVSLHPKLVETMRAGGWSWLVDATKDFMHFEDRAAQAALKRT